MSLSNPSASPNPVRWKDVVTPTVVLGALGYFVDIYDLLLFSIVRVPSLKALGLEGQQLLDDGVYVINSQMIGMLLGGLLWGVLGDKKGRLKVLFGSIFMYSIANILNAYVTNVHQYAILRFIAGFGLAGELGAAITLVSESLSKEARGYGTAIVAGVGVAGAVAASIVGELVSWQTAYIVGGALGLVLLVLRIKVAESGMFDHVKSSTNVARGSLKMLFGNFERLMRYIRCILVGVPLWYVIGILITFAPEFGKALGMAEPVTSGRAILFCYTGLIFGDFGSGILSQLVGSRRKILAIFLAITAVFVAVYGFLPGMSATMFYFVCFMLGIGTGYWALFTTVSAEQFGTNLRATVSTSAPNFVRGALVPITLSFRALESSLGIIGSAMAVGAVVFVLGFLSLWKMPETFGKDLDYLEH